MAKSTLVITAEEKAAFAGAHAVVSARQQEFLAALNAAEDVIRGILASHGAPAIAERGTVTSDVVEGANVFVYDAVEV